MEADTEAAQHSQRRGARQPRAGWVLSLAPSPHAGGGGALLEEGRAPQQHRTVSQLWAV